VRARSREVYAANATDAGHFVMMEKPDEFNQLVTSFVDTLTF